MATDAKADLQDQLTISREEFRWKLAGLSEHDLRRPLTSSGTNLLGLIKHLSTVQALYLGFLFGRPLPDAPAWMTPHMPIGADLWVRAEETSEGILELFERTSTHADETIDATPLDATSDVPWAPYLGSGATFHRVLVHVIGEAQQHLGHADICRELIDNTIGRQDGIRT